MSVLATVAGNSFNEKFPSKIYFPIGYFDVTIADADIVKSKVSPGYFDKVFGPHARKN